VKDVPTAKAYLDSLEWPYEYPFNTTTQGGKPERPADHVRPGGLKPIEDMTTDHLQWLIGDQRRHLEYVHEQYERDVRIRERYITILETLERKLRLRFQVINDSEVTEHAS
jgi:hypothetical protein